MTRLWENDVKDYDDRLTRLRARYSLPFYWFAHADHLSYTAAGIHDFGNHVDDIFSRTQELRVTERKNGQYVAIGKLVGSIAVPHVGSVNWVKIVQGNGDFVGIDHLGFYSDNIPAIKNQLLRTEDIDFSFSEEGYPDWAEIYLPNSSQFVSFCDQTLSEEFIQDKRTGNSTEVKHARKPLH